MGCDIHPYIESRDATGRWRYIDVDIFDCRSYGLFGWLADVRNYSGVPPISEPRGLPEDVSGEVSEEFESWGIDAHTPSWLSVDELLAFDYRAEFEDRRVTRQTGANSWDGGCTAEPGGGEVTTYGEFFGRWFFGELEKLEKLNGILPTRVVFWFDN